MLQVGIAFTVVGSIFLFFGMGLCSQSLPIGLIFSGFSSIFVVIGLLNIFKYKRSIDAEKEAKLHGIKIPNCRIVEYLDDSSIRINGMPILVIVCLDESTGQTYIYNTKQVSEWKYPMDSFIDVYVLNDIVFADKNSIRKELL